MQKIKNFNIAKLIAKEILWPTRCCICDVQGDVLCEKCYNSLQFIDSNRACKRCGGAYGRDVCTECNDVMLKAIGLDEFPFKSLRHCLVADENAIKIITTYKDRGERALANHIAQIMSRYVDQALMPENSYITYIPDTKRAYLRRGFDHAEEIASVVSRITGIPKVRVFYRPKTTDQRKLTKKERNENMSCSLSFINDNNLDHRKNLLIIDDVCTTGSTMYAAALQAKLIPFENVYGLTFAKVFE